MAHFSIRREPEATDDSEALSSSSDQVVVVVVVGKAKASDAEARSTGAPATNRQWRQGTTDVGRLMRTFSVVYSTVPARSAAARRPTAWLRFRPSARRATHRGP